MEMKNIIYFLILFSSTISYAQISSLSATDGSILITPRGLLGNTNSSSTSNVALGRDALKNNTTGNSNTAIGISSLYTNTTGFFNTTNGRNSLLNNTTGNNNTANGVSSLFSNTIGNSNTANGASSLYSNTIGNLNTATGVSSLYSNTTGNLNTATGINSLYQNTEGYENTANGVNSLYSNTTGDYNTASGIRSLFSNTSGNLNTAIGSFANVSSGALINATAIGANALVDANNKIQLGDGNVSAVQLGTGTNVTLETGLVKITGGTPGVGKVLISDAAGLATWAVPTGTHTIGESYGGGIVFYVYDNGLHGFIAATADQNGGAPIRWFGGSSSNTRARANGIGAGLKNTAIIIANQGSVDGAAFAATVCNEYSVTVGGVTYGDWYLPSKHELNLLYLQKDVVGGFANDYYWSSTESDFNYAWSQLFGSGFQTNNIKFDARRVRAVRAF